MRTAPDIPTGNSPPALPRSAKLLDLFNGESMPQSDDDLGTASSNGSPGYNSDRNMTSADEASPYSMSPWNPALTSPLAKSPWTHLPLLSDDVGDPFATGLVGSLVREEGHVYSLAASGDLLYTGSESKNIRVWKGRREFAGFKSSSGLVKAIVVAGERIFTGHQDGKIRVWKTSSKNPSTYKRDGTLPRLKDFLKSSMNPSNYVEVRRHKNAVWLRHFDAVSCLSLDEDAGLLYSGSWDRSVKVWRISDSKCVESIRAHDDAVNSVTVGFGGFLFTGSADGTVKVWRREIGARGATRHVLVQTLLTQESAVTAVAVVEDPAEAGSGIVYSGSSDGRVNHWRWAKGRRPVRGRALRGHGMAVLCLAAAGRVVVSGSADKTLCVWRREEMGDHSRLAVLAGHEGPIKCLAVEADSEDDGDNRGGRAVAAARYVVYSGSLDKSVKIWRVMDSETDTEATKKTPQRVQTNAGDGLRRSPFGARVGDATVSGGHVSNLGAGGKLRGFGSPVNQGLTELPASVRTAA